MNEVAIVCSWIQRLKLVKMSVLCSCYQSPSKIFVNVEKIILKIMWKGKEARRAETVLTKKNKIRIILRYFKTYLETKSVWY